jgi:hypothetical protein
LEQDGREKKKWGKRTYKSRARKKKKSKESLQEVILGGVDPDVSGNIRYSPLCIKVKDLDTFLI